MKNIVVVGSLNLDLVATLSRMPAEGETLTGKDFATFPGGKGANQAVAAARLGSAVTMIGCLGNDGFGDQLLQALQADNIDTGCIQHVDKPTGTAVILVTDQGHNSIVVIPGANHALTPEGLEQFRHVFANAAVILAQLEIPMETVVRLGEIAAELGVPMILDPAPATALPPALLRNVTWLTPNESETRIILEHLGHPGEKSNEDAAKILLGTGVKNVILKQGERGVYLATSGSGPVAIPPFTVNAVDTTAAGDAFNGGFAYALTQGQPAGRAAKFASAVAALSVTRAGAQPSMPKLDAVQALLGNS